MDKSAIPDTRPNPTLAPAVAGGFHGVLPLVVGRMAAVRVVSLYDRFTTSASAGMRPVRGKPGRPAGGGLTERHLAVIRYVNAVQHAKSSHIREHFFYDLSTTNTSSLKDTLRLLVDRKYLALIEPEPPGGRHGGRSAYVYRLGRSGHALFSGDEFKPKRKTVKHGLMVADVSVIVQQLKRAGLAVHVALYEPDCHETRGDEKLEPDYYLEFTHPNAGELALEFEVDTGWQSKPTIQAKYRRYVRAFERATDAEMKGRTMRVVFVAIDDDRVQQLERFLRDVDDEYKRLFRLVTRESLAGLLSPQQ